MLFRSLGLAPLATSQALSDEFRNARGLSRREAALDWMRANNLTHDRYVALVSRQARLSALCGGTETHALGLLHLVEPVCWLLDAIRLSGTYPELERRVGHRLAKARTAKTSKAAMPRATKTVMVKDFAAKGAKSVTGGAMALRRKVHE